MPVRSRSATSNNVMRYPEMTKNTSTPRKPPPSQRLSAWYTMTAMTASARRPSRPGMYGTVGPRRVPHAGVPLSGVVVLLMGTATAASGDG